MQTPALLVALFAYNEQTTRSSRACSKEIENTHMATILKKKIARYKKTTPVRNGSQLF
jgi:hypothetical protein